MSEITGAWIDEADDVLITVDTIRRAKRMLAQKAILPLKIRGHDFYIFPVDGDCRALTN